LLFAENRSCTGHLGGNVSSLEKFFTRSWKAGIIDVDVVLSDSCCRVFSIVPFEGRPFRDAPRFALTHLWKRSQSCSFDDSQVEYFPEYNVSGLSKCNLMCLQEKRHLGLGVLYCTSSSVPGMLVLT